LLTYVCGMCAILVILVIYEIALSHSIQGNIYCTYPFGVGSFLGHSVHMLMKWINYIKGFICWLYSVVT